MRVARRAEDILGYHAMPAAGYGLQPVATRGACRIWCQGDVYWDVEGGDGYL